MTHFRIGVDSYSLGPLQLSPFEMLDWAAGHGAEGVQFSSLDLAGGREPDRRFLEDLKAHAAGSGLYLEWGGGQHIPFDLETWRRKDILPINRRAAEQAGVLGATVIRSCSGGLMRWKKGSPPAAALIDEMALILAPQMAMLADHGVTLAIETHFEFTTFELLRLFEKCKAQEGGSLGICLDTMNLLTMLEDPVAATERILPFVVATHMKDGGLALDATGLVSFTAEISTGLVDLDAILDRLATAGRDLNLTVEDHGGSFSIPIFDADFVSRFPDLSAAELSRLLALAWQGTGRIRDGSLWPLEREEWPRHCEGRVVNGIRSLRLKAQRCRERRAGGP